MTLTPQNYVQRLARSRNGEPLNGLLSGASPRQANQIRLVHKSKAQASAKNINNNNNNNNNNNSNLPRLRTSGVVALPSRAASSSALVTSQAPKNVVRAVPKDHLFEYMRSPHYNRFYALFGGRVPRPHFTGSSGRRLDFFTAFSGFNGVAVPAGKKYMIYPVLYNGRVAASVFDLTGETSFDWDGTNSVIGNPAGGALITNNASFPANGFERVNPGYFNDSNLDLYGNKTVGTSAAEHLQMNVEQITWAQLLGGVLNVSVAVPYNGMATVYSLPRGSNPNFPGGSACSDVIIKRGSTTEGPYYDNEFKCVKSMPALPISKNVSGLFQTFGRADVVAGNTTRNWALSLGQDMSWYHPGTLRTGAGYDDNATSYAFGLGFAPHRNPCFFLQFGAVLVDNSGGSVPVTAIYNCSQTYAQTWPDLGVEGASAVADSLRASLLQSAPGLEPHIVQRNSLEYKHSLASPGNTPLPQTGGIRQEDHSHLKEATTAFAGAAVGAAEAKSSSVSRLLARAEGWITQKLGSAVTSYMERFAGETAASEGTEMLAIM